MAASERSLVGMPPNMVILVYRLGGMKSEAPKTRGGEGDADGCHEKRTPALLLPFPMPSPLCADRQSGRRGAYVTGRFFRQNGARSVRLSAEGQVRLEDWGGAGIIGERVRVGGRFHLSDLKSTQEQGDFMKVEVRLPELGDDKNLEASVSFWYFDADETVKEGEDLLEVVTDKATFNVPAPCAGKLASVVAGEGETVKANDLLGVIETEE